MKNAFLLLFFLLGLSLSGLHAQTCTPCPLKTCKPTCCKAKMGSVASTDSPLLMPVSFTQMNCTPEAMAQCQSEMKCTKKEMKACQAACSKGVLPACQSVDKNSGASEAKVDEQYHQVPQPQKG